MPEDSQTRTRFAPSPTGFQHIGGLRSAFYAWLVAKHSGGKFLLRIEDTDQDRLVPGAIRFILEELAWFGIVPDEAPSRAELEKIDETWEGMPDIGGPSGPYIQSLRLPRYREVADILIKAGRGYRCDCTPEMLEKERNEQMARRELPGYSGYCRTRDVQADQPHVVRFKMPTKVSVSIEDEVKGRVTWESVPMRDPVLLKSDGFPTYHLAVVVDDHDMKITHVMRGDEWLPSAPLHVMVYQALGWSPPKFAHLPVVLGTDGKKLSKRHGAVSSRSMRENGYLAEALLNYIILVGWSPGDGDEKEIFSREELIARFTLARVNNANAVFDENKLLWMNGVYIRSLSTEDFLALLKPFFGEFGESTRFKDFTKIAHLVKERVKTLKEVLPLVEFLFVDQLERDLPAMCGKKVTEDMARMILFEASIRLSELSSFDSVDIEAALRRLADKVELKVGDMLGVVRIAVMGKKVTPPLFESLAALGKDRVIRRLEETWGLLKI